ncbi:hypothetical protein [Pedobacter psychrodurus]|uniref:hypothetical protein n=1 Tax=Pedobacter psychrodurus TaxID=2530456 RepID=UPI00292D5170|nr:hypothetical protein [Pedobacter psychrodurus]
MMKTAFKTTAIFLLAMSILCACKKKTDDTMNFTIDDQNLTDCVQGTCRYEYVNNAAAVDQQFALTAGRYRVFSAKKENAFSKTWIYFQAPMQGDKFLLTDADILAGKVKHLFSCPTCDYYNLRPIAGSVKGIKVANTGAGSERWLLDAHVVVGAEKSQIPVDTIHIKQYFNLAVK